MTGYDPSVDVDDALPAGPARETFTERLKRLGHQLHDLAQEGRMPEGPIPYISEHTRKLAKKVLTARPFEERLDAIFRGVADKPRDPGQEG